MMTAADMEHAYLQLYSVWCLYAVCSQFSC